MIKKMSYEWLLRTTMAEHGMFQTSDTAAVVRDS